MNKRLLLIFIISFFRLLSYSQATSLTIDCQTPGWLSSMINYEDQQTIRDLRVTGYINSSDLIFIGKLIKNHSLDGSLDLSDVEITPINKLDENAFRLSKSDTIRMIIMPKSLKNSYKCFNTSKSGHYLKVDTLIAGGEIMHKISQNCFTGPINCVVFREGTDSINNNAFDGMGSLESLQFPTSLKYIGKSSFRYCSNLSSMSLPPAVEVIEDNAFYETSYKPDTLYLPDSLRIYYTTAFPLKEHQVIYIPEHVTGISNWYKRYVNNSYWYYSIYLGSITQPEIHVKAIQPPAVSDFSGPEGYGVTSGESFQNMTIYVPKGTKEAYESTKPWSNATIIEDEVIPLSINIDKDSITLIPNEIIQLIANLAPENADTDILWNSSDNRVASVDASGIVTARNMGNAIIYARTTYGSDLCDSCFVTVVQPVEALSLEKHNITLNIDEEEQLYANILPVNASNKNITWSSTDLSIVEVDADGNVTAKKRGVAFVKATSEDNPLAVDSCKVTVNQPVTGVTLNHKNCELHQIGETLQLVATVFPEDASNKDVRWTSSNESVCIVSNGTVVAVGYGTSVIIVITDDGNYMATCTVTVVEEADLPGDVNHDGEVNVADINAIIDIILGGNVDNQTKERADVNGDGEVNIADINAIIDIIPTH